MRTVPIDEPQELSNVVLGGSSKVPGPSEDIPDDYQKDIVGLISKNLPSQFAHDLASSGDLVSNLEGRSSHADELLGGIEDGTSEVGNRSSASESPAGDSRGVQQGGEAGSVGDDLAASSGMVDDALERRSNSFRSLARHSQEDRHHPEDVIGVPDDKNSSVLNDAVRDVGSDLEEPQERSVGSEEDSIGPELCGLPVHCPSDSDSLLAEFDSFFQSAPDPGGGEDLISLSSS